MGKTPTREILVGDLYGEKSTIDEEGLHHHNSSSIILKEEMRSFTPPSTHHFHKDQRKRLVYQKQWFPPCFWGIQYVRYTNMW